MKRQPAKIAEKVGVDRAKGNLLPEDKQSLVDSIAKREVIRYGRGRHQ